MISSSLYLYSLFPMFKKCSRCNMSIIQQRNLNQETIYFCQACQRETKWTFGTIIQQTRLLNLEIDKLLQLFVKRKNASDTQELFDSKIFQEYLNIKTVGKYFDLFSRIVLKYYINKLDTKLFDGVVELDETYLFKPKKTSAPRRPYVLGDIWLFGIKDRITKTFLILPLLSRKEDILITLIRRFIKIGSQIYSDSFSSYVNNKRKPKESKLIPLGYSHEFVVHKIEFVSSSFPEIHTNSIEGLWKDFKNFYRKLNLKSKYMFAVSRFHFHNELSENEQLRFLFEGLNDLNLPDYEEFEDMIFNNLYSNNLN